MYYSSVSASPSVVSQKHGLRITCGFRHWGFFLFKLVDCCVFADFRVDNILSFKCIIIELCFEDTF